VVKATHKGELLGIAPTGRRVRWDEVDVYRLSDGKITEEWALDDFTAILLCRGQRPNRSNDSVYVRRFPSPWWLPLA
jgi:SnoaL-like polyketide cyclase